MKSNESHDDGPDLVERCDECGGHDEDVSKCAAEDCNIYLHKHCGVECESCQEVICQEHTSVLDDCFVCPKCLPEMERIAGEDNPLVFADQPQRVSVSR
jgi:hypothetical protein